VAVEVRRIALDVPEGVVVYACTCSACGAQFGVVCLEDLIRHPRFCAYCAARTQVRREAPA